MKKLLAITFFLLFLLLGLSLQIIPTSASADIGSNTLRLQIFGPGQVNVLIKSGSGEESTQVCHTTICVIDLQGGDSVDLTPVSRSGAYFKSWNNFCTRSQAVCSFYIDPKITGEIIETKATFEYFNNKNPFLRKAKFLTSNSLLLQAACGGAYECSLRLGGYLRGGKRIEIEPIFFDLRAKERRTINMFAGKENGDIRNAIRRIGKGNKRARLFVRLTDIDTGKSKRMAINEKPACCFDKPKKPSKPTN